MIINSLSLAQLFGKDAFQDENVLTIKKSSLPRLSPNPINTAESLLVGILLKSSENFQGIITNENNQPITDQNNQPITFDNSDAYELLKVITWKPYQVNRDSQPHIINQIIIVTYAQLQ